jgi:hypothetical protein
LQTQFPCGCALHSSEQSFTDILNLPSLVYYGFLDSKYRFYQHAPCLINLSLSYIANEFLLKSMPNPYLFGLDAALKIEYLS